MHGLEAVSGHEVQLFESGQRFRAVLWSLGHGAVEVRSVVLDSGEELSGFPKSFGDREAAIEAAQASVAIWISSQG
jgi:hypothetical protein